MRKEIEEFTNNLIKLSQAKEKTGYALITGIPKDLVMNKRGEIIYKGFYSACVEFIVRSSERI